MGEAAGQRNRNETSQQYNSTEFGVPGQEPPPQYAWLGAAGVAGELPSGVITQDGITYVPQTGRPLQTEGVVLAALSNTPTPFTRPVEAWVGVTAGEGAAREIAKAEQAREEREAANKPPGAEPLPEGEFCGEGYSPCEGEGRAPLGGSGRLDGGCSGAGACAASYNECQLHWLFGEPNSGELWLGTGVRCSKPVAHIEVEGCFLAWDTHGSTENLKDYRQFGCVTESGSNKSRTGLLAKAECAEGLTYRVWVWGRAWGANFWFGTGGKTSGTWVCQDAGYAPVREYLEYKLEK